MGSFLCTLRKRDELPGNSKVPSMVLDEDAWTVLQSLVQNARDRVLDHKLFKEILEYYIAALKNPELVA